MSVVTFIFILQVLNVFGFPTSDIQKRTLEQTLAETVKVKIDRIANGNVLVVNSNAGVTSNLFQGDINLTRQQKSTIDSYSGRKKRQAISFATRWTGNKLSYYFDTTIDDRRKDSVRKALAHISKATCLDFEENSTAVNRVKVYSGVGCTSFVGMIGGEQLLSLGNNCNHVGTAAHEFIHALGMEHTHDRFDRDNFIFINTAAFTFLHAFTAVDAFRMTALVPYEYGSVMHYGADSFAKGDGLSIVSKDTNYTYTMGSGIISFYDYEAINELYKCRGGCSPNTLAKCMNGGQPNPRNCGVCNCPSGYGGTLCDQRPSGCGQTIAATTEWQTLAMVLGEENSYTFANDYVYCNYWITAPQDKQIEVKFTTMQNPLCTYGCFYNGVELKLALNPEPTGARICCQEFVNTTFISHQNPMPLVHFNSFSQSQFNILFRFVDSPCGQDHPMCSTEAAKNFCADNYYTQAYRRQFCPRLCNLCE